MAHGFPLGEGVEVALASERAVREAGAVPATVGVVDGQVRVGLAEAELERFSAAGAEARKLGARDIAACAVQGALGATTVGGTLAVARRVGIRFMGTGGLGGVHRGFPAPPDVSADLAELARSQALVVCSGVKSLLDVPATAELLETLGIPVLGYGTSTAAALLPGRGRPAGLRARRDAGGGGGDRARALGAGRRGAAARPPARREPRRRAAHPPRRSRPRRAKASRGQAVTPFVLAYLHRESGGRTQAVNRDLIVANAGLAGAVAAAWAG